LGTKAAAGSSTENVVDLPKAASDWFQNYFHSGRGKAVVVVSNLRQLFGKLINQPL